MANLERETAVAKANHSKKAKTRLVARKKRVINLFVDDLIQELANDEKVGFFQFDILVGNLEFLRESTIEVIEYLNE